MLCVIGVFKVSKSRSREGHGFLDLKHGDFCHSWKFLAKPLAVDKGSLTRGGQFEGIRSR